MSAQLALIEPAPRESIGLAAQHLTRAEKLRAQAQKAQARGWASMREALEREARDHEAEADDLAAYFDLCDLAGVCH